MSDDRKDLPSPSAANFTQRVRETLLTYLGTQGDVLDRGVTLRDLSDAGLIDISKTYLMTRRGAPVAGPGPSSGGGLPGPPGPPGPSGNVYEPDLTPPPTPEGFTVGAGISHLFIGCAPPIYTQGHGHLLTRLYGATWTTGDPLPVFSDAVQLTAFQGTVFAHATNPATTWHLWVTWVTRDGVESTVPAGGTNGLVVTTAQDVSSLLEALTGQITQSQLYADLGARIDLIDGTGVGSVNARIASEAAALQSGIDTVSAQVASLAGTEAYDNATSYAAGELVQYLGKLYRAKTGTVGNLPTNATYWDLVGDYASLGEAVAAHSVQLSQHDTRITTTEAGLTAEATARDTLATQLRGGYTGTDPNALTQGLVYNERVARVTADSANASLISGVSSDLTTTQDTVSGQGAAISGLQTTVSGQATSINALQTGVTTLNGMVTSQASAITTLNSSLTTTNTNVTAAQTAATNAANAAGAKGEVIYGSVQPAVDKRLAQNLWIDTTSNANTPKRWDGTAWVAVSDKIATDAAAAAAAASAAVSSKADASALTALSNTVTSQGNTLTSQGGSITALSNTINDPANGLGTKASSTALNSLSSTVTSQGNTLTSQASALTTLQSQMTGATSSTIYAAVQTEAATRALQTGDLYAKYTVKVDVAGLVSGYGLASTANNAPPTSSFGVRVNSFFVAPPAVASATAPTVNLYDGFVWLDTSLTPNVTRYCSGSSWTVNPPVLPFVVQTTPTTVNGVAVPAGVYANDLFVKNGTITNAKIANLAVDDAKIANLSVSKLTAGSLAVGQYVQSTNYVPNVSGWQWRADGSAELGSQYIRGKLTAAQIDTRGLDIRDASGNVILSSGSSLHSQVGPFAGLSKITGTNISTYIADLAVNTLQIANNAVTIPVGAALTSDVYTTSLSPVAALSVYLESRGAPIFISFEAALLAMDVSENWQNQKGYLVLLVNGAEVRRIDTNATFGRVSFKNVSAQHYVQSTGFGTTIQLAICSSRSQTETSVHTQWYQLYGGIYGGTSLFAIGTKR